MEIKSKENYTQLAGLTLLFFIIVILRFHPIKLQNNNISQQVISAAGFTLPVRWGDLGVQMTAAGVIDAEKFNDLYSINGKLDEETEKLINGDDNGNIKITSLNSPLILNLFWALGIGNKNEILERGPMADPHYGGPSGLASIGGWTLAKGDPSTNSGRGAMDHYSKHSLIALTAKQQKLVEEVSKNIYRPCCDNPTYFPDCNHGMAMLGLLELMASQGVSESDMYKAALQVNSYWFPDTYLTIARYLKEKKNVNWEDVNPKEILGQNYSSVSGYQKVLTQMSSVKNSKGSSCEL